MYPAPAIAATTTARRPRAQSRKAARLRLPDGSELAVVQQPSGQFNYVSGRAETATQFAASEETLGLLAHNTLAGAHFHHLRVGARLSVTFQDGRVQRYVVRRCEAYRAAGDAESYQTDFVHLATRERLNAQQVFRRIYKAGHALVLQTCIEREGLASWGRLFLIADAI